MVANINGYKRTFPARYGGTCKACGKAINVGDEITCDYRPGYRHSVCPPRVRTVGTRHRRLRLR